VGVEVGLTDGLLTNTEIDALPIWSGAALLENPDH
jgi:hypothetical protein